MNASDPVQFGILGVGRITVNAFAPALTAATNATLAAAASRDVARAQALHPPRAYADYLELLDDPAVEAVYIATHNGLHHPLTLRALERGKHVLCEKPLANDAAECAEMVAAARQYGRHLMEAFMYRYHPQMPEAAAIVQAGTLGEIKTLEASFSFHLTSENDVRLNPAWGGGGLLDVGCYCVNLSRFLMGGMPHAVTAMGTFHPVHGVDMSLHGVLDFGGGRYAVISCGFDAGFRNRVLVCGTKGTLTLTRPFANRGKPATLIVDVGGDVQEKSYPPPDLFRLQIEDFARAVRGGPPPLLAPEDGLLNARVLDALLAAARNPARCEMVGV